MILRKFIIMGISLTLYSHARAGGASSAYLDAADRIVKQDAILHQMVTNTFKIEEQGNLGPLEQREVNGVLGRHYFYHEFTAIDKTNQKKYRLQIHFKKEIANPEGDRSFYNRRLDKLVFIPQEEKNHNDSEK